MHIITTSPIAHTFKHTYTIYIYIFHIGGSKPAHTFRRNLHLLMHERNPLLSHLNKLPKYIDNKTESNK